MAAKVHPLKLSDLKANTDYPLGNELSEGKCLIHVKLTDLCVKSIEGLMNSEKVSSCTFSLPRFGLKLCPILVWCINKNQCHNLISSRH